MIFANELTPADFITLFGLGFLCALFFLISGVMLVITKNVNLISKKTVYREEKLFTTIYGCVDIIFSTLMIVILVIGVINQQLYLWLFLLLGIVVITMLLIHYMLQRKFKIEK